ncbi:helix-turn-helix protein [Dysgonomonas alginatilytica]|uniref:Helix-turn-helix protein n=1 Tax=Dysgonomonas alginatilytica TaxID=1605892 RepID=A0A2V3PJQ7_9BACT|nr:helix-turn-helix domain-containing protein [Dysgonomonas alginatilytica]PXV58808.1 helix-turn-helix protein [Dysgonomonas alginatilytica]
MDNKVILIQEKVFDALLSRVEALSQEVAQLHKKYKSKQLGEKLDGRQVCDILNIKNRTLQTYRDTGRIGFSQIGDKITYRVNDVDKLLKENMIVKSNNPKTKKSHGNNEPK